MIHPDIKCGVIAALSPEHDRRTYTNELGHALLVTTAIFKYSTIPRLEIKVTKFQKYKPR